MKTALFHNFTNKEFIAYWDGKPHVFKPGAKKYMDEGVASVFAKHLANKILQEKGQETMTSPKFPNQVPMFKELFDRACVIDEEEMDEASANMEILNKQPSGDIEVIQPEVIKPNRPVGRPRRATAVKPADQVEVDEEDEFEGNKDA